MAIRQKTIKSMIWNLGENIFTQIINFITGIYMARILSPSDYGLMGMLLIFTALSDAIINGGFGTALICKSNRTDNDAATTFYFNIVAGICLYCILYISAPHIATFYNTPILKDLIKVTSIPLVINSFYLVQRTFLTIHMDFKRQAKISIVSALAKGGVGIYMAHCGYGVWSIAWSSVSGSLISCILYWWHSAWQLRFKFSWYSFQKLFSFGSKLMLSNILDVLGNNLFSLIIGKQFTALILGYYSRAYGYAYLPAGIFSGVLSRVSLPILSQIQEDNKQLEKVYQQILNMVVFITFPLMTGLALLARPLIILMITDKWLPCVEYLQILCFAFMIYPIHALNLNLLQVKGRSDLFLRLEIIKKGMMLLLLGVAIPFGVQAICIGGVISSFIAWGINAYYTGEIINIGFKKQVMNILPIIGYTMVMAICVYLTKENIEGELKQFILSTIIGIVSYFTIAHCCQSQELKSLLLSINSMRTFR